MVGDTMRSKVDLDKKLVHQRVCIPNDLID